MVTEGQVKEFYISTNGDDSNPGLKEKPFKSIIGARNAIRRIKGDMEGDIVVYIRGGVYEINDTIEFDNRDSGSNGCNIIYRNYLDETPVISGGKRIKGWEKVKDSKIKNLWKAYAPFIDNTRQLFINGTRAVRARGRIIESKGWEIVKDPNMQFYNLMETFKSFQGERPVYEGYKTADKDMAFWKNKRDIEFVYDVGWTHSICPVDDIIPVDDGAIVKMRMPCFRDCQIKGGVQIGSPNYIENAYELLDEPGEWYFDGSTGEIFYIPKPGEDMKEIEAIVPVVEKLIAIHGTLDMPVENLYFEGITFIYSTWLRPSVMGHAEIQANLVKNPANDDMFHSYFINTPSTVILDAAKNIQIRNCRFYRLGSGAIDIQNGSCNNLICGNIFSDIAASGVQLGGFTLEDAHPYDERVIVRDNIIANNYFNNIGSEYKGSIAVTAGYTDGTRITHNEICHVSYSGISVGWGWGYWDVDADKRTEYPPLPYYPVFTTDTVARNNRIEYNHIHHVMEKLHDGGAIYTLSSQEGSSIIGNYCHDNGHGQDGGWPGGIYQDEASGGFEVTGNITYNISKSYCYHNVGIPGREESNSVHDNYFDINPDNGAFPKDKAESAGLEEPYRYLLNIDVT